MYRLVASVSLLLCVMCVTRVASQGTTIPLVSAQDSLGPHLETGCSGGVTGGGGGVTVTENGGFYSWSQPRHVSSERELTLLHSDSAQAAALFSAALERGLTRVEFSEPSNMTCFLSLERGDQHYEVAWPYGTTPRKIRKLVELANEIQEAAKR